MYNQDSELRTQQDIAFQKSLMIDREKRDNRLAEEEVRRYIEQEAKDEDLKTSMRNQQRLIRARDFPKEPVTNVLSITFIIRLLNGNRIQRRFLLSDTMSFVYAFVDTQEETLNPYKLATQFPTRVYDKSTLCLKDLGLLLPRLLLFVQE